MKHLFGWLLIVLLFSGCSRPQAPESPPPTATQPIPEAVVPSSIEPVTPPVAREADPAVDAEDLTELTAGNQAFAFDFYHALDKGDENLVFSPYSITSAFSMVYAGARNRTADQMAATLHYTLPITTHHAAFNALDQRLNAQTADDAFRLETTNGMWLQRDFPFEPAYLETVAANYDLALWLADFIDPEHRDEATRFINDWTAQQTNGRIKEILGPDTLDELTRLVLVNAIYFKADWLHPFNRSATQDLSFTRLDGTIVETPQMVRRLNVPYATGDGYQTVALPYQGERTRMVAILPEPDRFLEIEEQLSPALQEAIRSQLTDTDVEVVLSKFEFSSNLNLVKILSTMGLLDLFVRGIADLSGIAPLKPQDGLFVADALHQALIAVDEKGTEAAATTAIEAAQASQPVTVEFNHPFIYWIEEVETGEILFLGRVMDPSQEAEE